jgi:hypothetical protein
MKSVLALLLAAPLLAAQPSPIPALQTETARRLLDSPGWREKAWGAYLAARLHSDDLNRLLGDQLLPAAALRDAAYHSDEYAYLTVLFDAAIEAGIRVPAALLEPFQERWPAPVLILLARDPESTPALLRIRTEQAPPLVWLAASNLLFERKSQPWFAALLGEIRITHRLIAVDSRSGAGYGEGSGGGICGDGITAMPKGFPPVVLYELRDAGVRDAALLAHGPRDLFYQRLVIPTDKQVGTGSCNGALDRPSMRLAYLAMIRGIPAYQVEQVFRASTNIAFTTPAAFEQEANRLLADQEQAIRTLLTEIAARGLHAPGVPLRIVPEVIDHRTAAREALPAIAERPIAR